MSVVLRNTPVFYRSDIRSLLAGGMSLDNQGLFRPLELIAFEGSPVEIIDETEEFFRVQLSFYPVKGPLFIHKIFVGRGSSKKRVMPTKEKILESMNEKQGLPYIWGGNSSLGVEEMLTLFPPPQPLSQKERDRWTFRGLDCSGLLYEATEGLVPRNTSWMMKFGKPVEGELEPLDLILFEGHVIMVTEDGKTIESHLESGGVVLRDLEERLAEIQKPLSFRRCF